LVILSDKGKEITKDCFQEEDAPEPDFDWTTAPGMDYNNVYHPPVLAKTTHPNLPSLCLVMMTSLMWR
jgi:hypothetical protein